MWKSGKQWLFASSTKSKWLNLNRKSAQAIKLDLPTEEKGYQRFYNDDEDGNARRKLKNAGGITAGLGFSVMGGGLVTDAAANTLEAPLQKEVNNDVLANKDSVGIELTNSNSTTVERSISESTSESTTETKSEQSSEMESRVDMGLVWSDGWSGNTYTVTFVLNVNGTVTMSVNISGITASVQNVFGLYLQADNGVITGWAGQTPAPLTVVGGRVSGSKTIPAADVALMGKATDMTLRVGDYVLPGGANQVCQAQLSFDIESRLFISFRIV